MSARTMDRAEMLVISAPSGAGKDLLLKRLLRARPEVRKPITTTTRPPRAHERHGVHYFFMDELSFEEAVRRGEFIEHARYPKDTGHYYGLSHAALAATRRLGGIPAVILDVQGAASVRQVMPTLSVFVEAPVEDIVRRIRANRPDEEVEGRIEAIRYELAQAPFFDVRIQNPDGRAEAAVQDLLRWWDGVASHRLRRPPVARPRNLRGG